MKFKILSTNYVTDIDEALLKDLKSFTETKNVCSVYVQKNLFKTSEFCLNLVCNPSSGTR